jgi:elongation factor Ts
MAEITAALVKELRETSGAGMMDCKKALTESGGDIEAAVDWLRKKGLAAAAKKAGRVAAEGLIGVAAADGQGAVVEVNAETDFVARNEQFQGFVRQVADLALKSGGDIEALRAQPYPGSGRSVAEELTQMIATIGENMNLRRIAVLSVPAGCVASYVHNQAAPGLGKIGVLVALESTGESTGDRTRLAALGRQLAMHVAAAAPQAVDASGVDPEALARERDVLAEQARASGKPEEIIQKMVEGRLRKFYEDVCLLDQTFVIDGENKVRKVLEQAAKELGAPVKVTGFVRFMLGEGIEREETDFAAEVAAQLGH